MNMRLMLTVIAAMGFAPLVATHTGFRPDLEVGSGYTRGWQAGTQGDASEQNLRFECVAAGADLLRRAAPDVIGGSAKSAWGHGSFGLSPVNQLVCLN